MATRAQKLVALIALSFVVFSLDAPRAQDKAPARALSSVLLTGDDLKAFNSFDAPQRVVPRTLDKPSIAGGRAKFEVPARSYAVIQWEGQL